MTGPRECPASSKLTQTKAAELGLLRLVEIRTRALAFTQVRTFGNTELELYVHRE